VGLEELIKIVKRFGMLAEAAVSTAAPIFGM
jgi:hypothetical protein